MSDRRKNNSLDTTLRHLYRQDVNDPIYGKPFDPDAEGPSEADLQRYGEGDDEQPLICPECDFEAHSSLDDCPRCGASLFHTRSSEQSQRMVNKWLFAPLKIAVTLLIVYFVIRYLRS